MGRYLSNGSWETSILIMFIFVVQINCIYQTCSSNTDCPANSFCGYRSYCVCNNGWIMNCSTPGQGTSGTTISTTISQDYSYFVITPQNLYEYIKFAIKISTTETVT